MAKCKECKFKTEDHYCSHPRTQDKEGKPCLARQVWFVSFNGRKADYCAGNFFEPIVQ